MSREANSWMAVMSDSPSSSRKLKWMDRRISKPDKCMPCGMKRLIYIQVGMPFEILEEMLSSFEECFKLLCLCALIILARITYM